LPQVGLTDQHVARRITGWLAVLGSSVTESAVSEQLD